MAGLDTLDAGREIRLSGLYVWSVLFAEDGARVPRYGALEEAGDPHLRGDKRNDRTGSNPAGPRDGGSEAQPHDDWVGQLLLSRASQQGLSGGGTSRLQKAVSVVACQAQRGVAGDQELDRKS